MPKETVELLPVTIHPNWVEAIQYTQENFPHGQICFTIVDGVPVKVVAKYTHEAEKKFGTTKVKSSVAPFKG